MGFLLLSKEVIMLEALSTPRNRIRTFILLVVCGALAMVAGAEGIDDNPPGIFLAFGSACALVLAVVHPWRASKQFLHLVLASGLGLIVFGLLHNLFEAIAGSSGLFHGLLSGASAASFVIAILVCPIGLLVGAGGAFVMSIRNRHPPTSGTTTAA